MGNERDGGAEGDTQGSDLEDWVDRGHLQSARVHREISGVRGVGGRGDKYFVHVEPEISVRNPHEDVL